jgi:hypothetical protein
MYKEILLVVGLCVVFLILFFLEKTRVIYCSRCKIGIMKPDPIDKKYQTCANCGHLEENAHDFN